MPQETTEPLFPPGTVFPEDEGDPILPKPERIEVLYQPMGYDLFYHTLIVYTDSEGNQWAARGDIDAQTGMLRTTVQPYVEGHEDWNDKGDDPSLPVAEGTDLSAVWEKISNAVLEMDNKSKYENLNNNCHTVTSHGLHAAGINYRPHPEISDWQAPGAEKNPDDGVDFLNGDAKPDEKDDRATASPEESPDLPESPPSGGSGSWDGSLDNILGTLGNILGSSGSRGVLGASRGKVLDEISDSPRSVRIDGIRNPANPEPSNPESPEREALPRQTPVETPAPSVDPDGNPETPSGPITDPDGSISGTPPVWIDVQEPVYSDPVASNPDSWAPDPIVVTPEPEPEDRDRLAIESPTYGILTFDKDGNPVTIDATYLYDENDDPLLNDQGIPVLEDTDGRRLSIYEGEEGERAIYEDGGYPWGSDSVGWPDEADLSDGNTGFVVDLPLDDYDYWDAGSYDYVDWDTGSYDYIDCDTGSYDYVDWDTGSYDYGGWDTGSYDYGGWDTGGWW